MYSVYACPAVRYVFVLRSLSLPIPEDLLCSFITLSLYALCVSLQLCLNVIKNEKKQGVIETTVVEVVKSCAML